MPGEFDPLYILARRVLLDALEAIGSHRAAVTLVGAQAIYLNVGSADLVVPEYTTDADLALDPRSLEERPPIGDALAGAKFIPDPIAIGTWVAKHRHGTGTVDVCVDLLVPDGVAGPTGRRAARLPGHGDRAARRATGLEGALVDRDIKTIAAMEPADPRRFDVHVAGPAALVVAKVHKIDERAGSQRSSDKDALDVLRILRSVSTSDLSAGFHRLRADALSATATERALGLISGLFGRVQSHGSVMAARAAYPDSPDTVAASCVALVRQLLGAV
jgi:hypothetical protein